MPPLAFAAVFAFYLTYLPRGKRGTVFAIESANIVGYQNVSVPNGYSIFTATFKNVSAATIDLNTLTPQTPAGVALEGDGKVLIFTLDSKGNYGEAITWVGSKGGWSQDNGSTLIPDGTVSIGNGMGFAVYNTLKTLDGVESTNRKAVASPSMFTVSGEVDLVCANVIPAGYSVNGNSTPVAIDLTEIIPQTPAGDTLEGDGKVLIFTLDSKGNYGEAITWVGSKSGWSQDNGATLIAAGTYVIEPGAGFAVYNTLKTLDGVESTNRKAVASPAVLKLPSPIK